MNAPSKHLHRLWHECYSEGTYLTKLFMTREETLGRELLKEAGIEVNGSQTGDIQVHNPGFYRRVIAEGSLGFGESYMDGWWDSDAVDETVTRILAADLGARVRTSPKAMAIAALSVVMNRQSKSRAFNIGEAHYDIGNDLYEAMLDRRMVYTCGYWAHATTLDEAQDAKLDLVCKKIGLKTGDTVLDIGCGWGSFAKFAAERYGAHVTGITVSKEQRQLAEDRTKGLPVKFLLQDYRDTKGEFDHIVSLGMVEHVGYRNYRTYMEMAHRCLKPGGFFLLHTIGGNRSVTSTDAWIEKYIFPNSMLPSIRQLAEASEGLFVMEDWHNFGADYDKTLMAWQANFEAHWPSLAAKYGERFKRMWDFYLLSCAATFRTRRNQLWQIVFSKGGVPGGYTSVR